MLRSDVTWYLFFSNHTNFARQSRDYHTHNDKSATVYLFWFVFWWLVVGMTADGLRIPRYTVITLLSFLIRAMKSLHLVTIKSYIVASAYIGSFANFQ